MKYVPFVIFQIIYATKSNIHDDVVDWDVNQLDEKPNEAHDGKPDSCGHGNLLEL